MGVGGGGGGVVGGGGGGGEGGGGGGVKGSREKGKMGVDASARECVIERVSEGGRV